ncbi:MAG: hypothetical protein ACLR5G_00295 [Eubacteriales bacterium]
MKTGSEAARHDVCTRGKQPYYQDKEHNRDIRHGHGYNGSGDEEFLKRAEKDGRLVNIREAPKSFIVTEDREEGICLAALCGGAHRAQQRGRVTARRVFVGGACSINKTLIRCGFNVKRRVNQRLFP